MLRAIVVLLVVLVVSGCSSFQLGERYDKSLDDDLSAFQIEAVTFVASMRLNSGTPAGAFTSDAARAFYPKASGTLSNIVVKAGLLSSRQCPINGIANSIGLPTIKIGGETIAADTPKTVVTGNCAVVTLLALQNVLADLEASHRDHQKIGPVRGQLAIDDINKAVATTLSGLRAKDL